MSDIISVGNPYGLVQQAGRRSRKTIYRARVKASPCRGQTERCRVKYGCKKTRRGKRRSYCRKRTNRHA